jgi:hypothetical protein
MYNIEQGCPHCGSSLFDYNTGECYACSPKETTMLDYNTGLCLKCNDCDCDGNCEKAYWYIDITCVAEFVSVEQATKELDAQTKEDGSVTIQWTDGPMEIPAEHLSVLNHKAAMNL